MLILRSGLCHTRQISLYVSKGKEIKTNKMPNVLNKNIDTAEKMLKLNAFDKK